MKVKHGLIIVVVFCTIILVGFVYAISKVFFFHAPIYFGDGKVKERVSTFESSFNSIYSSSNVSLDLFSLTQRVLGKHETRNFEVLRANDDQLYLGYPSWPSDYETLMEIANQVSEIKSVVEGYGGHFLFCQIPYKNAERIEELKGYSTDYSETAEDRLCSILSDKGIEVLDLRAFEDCCEYYKTDHHWSLFSAFNSSRHIVEELEKRFGFTFDNRFGDFANYDSIDFGKTLLGSIGVKVGPYFAGKDSFIVYNPRFDTDLSLHHFVEDGKLDHFSQGSFWDAFIDESTLLDEDYYNKYNSLLFGSWFEAIISNKKADNDSTSLLITHSYGRGLAQYLGLYFSELRYIDPQKGRYNYGVINYIEENKPDFVILSYNGLLDL